MDKIKLTFQLLLIALPLLSGQVGLCCNDISLDLILKVALKSPNFFEKKSFYLHMEKEPQISKILFKRWYAELFQNTPLSDVTQMGILKKNSEIEAWSNKTEQQLGVRYLPLLLDPGIANRFPAFIEFAEHFLEQNKSVSSWELREGFKKHLGTSTIFRGLSLNISDLEKIKVNGLLAPAFLNHQNRNTKITKLFDVNNGNSLIFDIADRMTGGSMDSITMSVTKYSEIATEVARMINHTRGISKNKAYVFKMQIPELSIVYLEGSVFTKEGRNGNLKIGALNLPANDPGIEMFIFNQIPPNAITEIIEI